jgi:peptidoglycan/LPS O-acetylase OafA/YrhL
LAITAIVFHNFFHAVVPVHENEFSFDPARFSAFVHYASDYRTVVQALFAFFGHFGVQIFIFLSAYGLAKSHWDDEEPWSSFMWSRIKKLYPMFGLVLTFWVLMLAITHPDALQVLWENVLGLGLLLAGISTILPWQGLPVVGPWWFIPFIMQFYAIWYLLRGLTKRFGWKGLVALSIGCYAFTFLLNPLVMQWDINLSMTPLGRMRILCLGIIAAKFPIRLKPVWAIPALGLVILGSANIRFSQLTSIAITVFSLTVYSSLRPFLRRIPPFEHIGTYSLAIFLVNGIVRVPFVYFADSPYSQLALGVASALVTYLVSVFLHYLLASRPWRRQVPRSGIAGAPEALFGIGVLRVPEPEPLSERP